MVYRFEALFTLGFVRPVGTDERGSATCYLAFQYFEKLGILGWAKHKKARMCREN